MFSVATPMPHQRGQMTVSIVWVVIGMLIAVSIGGLVFSKVQQSIPTEENTIGENVKSSVNEGARTIFRF